MKDKKIFTDKKFITIIATLCCLLWGSAYPAVKSGYELFNISTGDIPSKLVFAGYRFSIAGLILLVIAQRYGKKIFNISKKNTLDLFYLGIIQTTLQYLFFYIGLANTTGVKSSIMNSTATFSSVILAHYIYKNDKLNVQKTVGCVVGFIGVMIVNFSSDLLNFSFNFSGEGFIIIAAFVFSVGAIYGKKLTKSMDVMVVTGYSLFLGGVILVFIGVVFGGRVYHFTTTSSILLIYLALLSSVAFSLWNLLLKYNKVGPVSVFNFLTPIFGVILSAIFLGENIFEYKNIIALVLVSSGIWMANKEKVSNHQNIVKVKKTV
ncbi:DMT family transporter [Clostridium magnum]|uniref:Putative DMT superfamily transporter inner membrane protein n=1 Tax=Clostridium magnum DSM 2767 TaxID=1121326 RepID=A0A162SIX1_9CLOT|nr:DMT family transporter [Clostridium magnum]KZL91333.1 putative DMT superfamily transporter inner membrane protein [Clostridium magnum DSM 2767]SHH38298.1 Permease of the drug/metabolite transporter (DMT) superfamily [Clostridium magnum DSM 2767]